MPMKQIKPMQPIALSFKNNTEDYKLYTWIVGHSNMSGFVKDALREIMKAEEVRNKKIRI